jgi:hypothetical protein
MRFSLWVTIAEASLGIEAIHSSIMLVIWSRCLTRRSFVASVDRWQAQASRSSRTVWLTVNGNVFLRDLFHAIVP